MVIIKKMKRSITDDRDYRAQGFTLFEQCLWSIQPLMQSVLGSYLGENISLRMPITTTST
jgi:hypothetical protein